MASTNPDDRTAGKPAGTRRPPTIRDIARLADVSKSAVARALNGDGYVSPELRDRVLEAARALGYKPNVMGRNLRLQRTHAIGLIIADITNPFYSFVADGVLEVARESGYRVVVLASDEDPALERQCLDLLMESRADGIVAVPTGANTRAWQQVADVGAKVVLIDRDVPGLDDVDIVRVDNVDGARTAVRHLVELGHTRIATLVGPTQISTARERLEGYRLALHDAGIAYDPRLVVSNSYKREHGTEAALELLRQPDPPTAILATNNLLGEATLLAADQLGLAIPQDISVVMFDDVPWAELTRPKLTTVSQPTRQIGRLACRQLVEQIEAARTGVPAAGPADHDTALPTELLVRDSTAPPSPR
ncbi:LacI family DNA-binding transcriptional regulator [Jiangella asiatica]|uniref:LacI family transcriptional regulator n=1 Tax=Jiangella asiatica TaxID=2530372 RepID=A0A4R5CQR4_9ACTN|nr:LacI family DNA-binding transcriptional regulator [Jiangella asiatica]TDE01171.1 LacI family transcriptional regulator [Jiangella asiatica]